MDELINRMKNAGKATEEIERLWKVVKEFNFDSKGESVKLKQTEAEVWREKLNAAKADGYLNPVEEEDYALKSLDLRYQQQTAGKIFVNPMDEEAYHEARAEVYQHRLERLQVESQKADKDAPAEKERLRKNVLAVKENQKSLYEDIKLYFEDEEHLKKIIAKGGSYKTVEKNHGRSDTRKYYQTSSIGWLENKDKWKGIKSIGMAERTFDGITERRYYISSCSVNPEEFAYYVRGHWSVETMHWLLDVNFKEDANHTINKTAAQNQNIIRKWCLSMLKHIEFIKPNMSLRMKMKLISFNPAKYLDYVMSL